MSGAAEAEIAAAAREEGMLTLREDGLHKVRDGDHLDRGGRPGLGVGRGKAPPASHSGVT